MVTCRSRVERGVGSNARGGRLGADAEWGGGVLGGWGRGGFCGGRGVRGMFAEWTGG